MAIQGSCLCGGVRFEVEPPFRRANHCHCSRCRKHSGTFGLTQGRVARERFRLLAGKELLRVYTPAEGGAVKVFCSVCGSNGLRSLVTSRWVKLPYGTVWLPSSPSTRAWSSASPGG